MLSSLAAVLLAAPNVLLGGGAKMVKATGLSGWWPEGCSMKVGYAREKVGEGVLWERGSRCRSRACWGRGCLLVPSRVNVSPDRGVQVQSGWVEDQVS